MITRIPLSQYNPTDYAGKPVAVWIDSNEVEIRDGEDYLNTLAPDAPSLSVDNAKAKVVADIDAYARALRDSVTGTYSHAEMASWPLKLTEAQGSGARPILTVEAAARGVPVQALVDKVVQKATAFMQLEGAISGVAGKHQDAVRALNSVTAILTYDWKAGWPI